MLPPLRRHTQAAQHEPMRLPGVRISADSLSATHSRLRWRCAICLGLDDPCASGEV